MPGGGQGGVALEGEEAGAVAELAGHAGCGEYVDHGPTMGVEPLVADGGDPGGQECQAGAGVFVEVAVAQEDETGGRGGGRRRPGDGDGVSHGRGRTAFGYLESVACAGLVEGQLGEGRDAVDRLDRKRAAERAAAGVVAQIDCDAAIVTGIDFAPRVFDLYDDLERSACLDVAGGLYGDD